jgi:hypothetical protein
MRKMDRSAGEWARRVAIFIGILGIIRFSALPTNAQNAPAGAPQGATLGSASSQWPLHLDTSSGQTTVYQPQLTSFDGDKLTARAAVSVIPPGQTDPTFGAIWMESRVATDRVARTVQILDITVTKVRFPDAAGPTEQALTDAMRATLPQQPMTLSLDSMLSMLEVVQKEKEAVRAISTDAPQIIFRDHASILVRFDGDPRLEQVPNSKLLRAVNTPFFVVLDPQSKTYFLKGGGQWFAARQALGPYADTNNVPPQLQPVADALGYKDPQEALSPAQAAGIDVVTVTVPSELIWTDGPEQMQTIDGTNLLYVANTDCDIFLQIDTQTIYILVSGRWFSAPHRTGPWTFVPPDKLPDDFQRIPADSPKGDVLAHIANTQQAKDAVADTFVPQTAAINRQTFEQPDVEYDGDPNFQPIANTTMTYAVNTPDSVVCVENRYYCCHSAVWYWCDHPRGTWFLCDHVPDVIYTVPPSCPIYPCRYVYVYDATPDLIYCGYLPGYVGCYHYDGVVVYGTGFYYRPWLGHVYYPRPFTYGFDAHYDSYRNHWGFSIGLAFGGGDAWVGNRGDEVRHDDWFGHGGYRPGLVRDDRTVNIYRTHISNVTINRTNVYNTQYNVYDRRKDVRNDVSARPDLRTPNRPVETHTDLLRQEAVRAEPGIDSRDNVYTDSKGDVYRKTLDGWEKRDHNQWAPAETPAHEAPARAAGSPRDVVDRHVDQTPAQSPHEAKADRPEERAKPVEPDRSELDRDFRARVEGEERSRAAPSDSHDQPRSDSRGSDSKSGDGSRASGSSHSGGGGGSSGGGSGNGNGNGNGSSNSNSNSNGNSKH